jgi:hypothetical protein
MPLTTRFVILPFLLTAAAMPVACGSDQGQTGQSGDGGTMGTTGASCSRAATTICNKIAACNPHGLHTLYGDTQTCVARLTPGCPTTLAGTSWTAARLDACASAWEEASCGATMEPDDFIPACNPTPGSLADGAACFNGSQCAGGACNKGAEVCGTCGTAPPPPGCGGGSACTPPMLCGRLLTGIMCAVPHMEGASCGVDAVCEPTFLCKGGVCARRAAAGTACTSSAECDFTQGLMCIDQSCQAPTYAPPGGACDEVRRFCERGAICDLVAIDSGNCVAPAADGAPCPNNVPCLQPAVCRDGICQIPDGSQCK